MKKVTLLIISLFATLLLVAQGSVPQMEILDQVEVCPGAVGIGIHDQIARIDPCFPDRVRGQVAVAVTEIIPEQQEGQETQIFLTNDGNETAYEHVKNIEVRISNTTVHLIRLKGYDFWSKVKDKFL